MQKLKPPTMKLGNNYFRRDADRGFYPLFTQELNRRVANKEACILCVVGEAGIGKSYLALQLARNIDKRFGIDQIVFTYSEYCKELAKRHMGLPIVFDEPSYAMGKREWYKEINNALVKTIESQRFMVRPLIIPIINVNLLDKTLRDYLIIFQVHVTKRGRAFVYRMRASQGQSKIYRYLMCRIQYPMLDFDKCKKDSCLDCKKKDNCELLRAHYERKKRAIQLARYEQDEEKAKIKESHDLTLEQLCAMIKPYASIYCEDDKVNARKLRFTFHQKLGIRIGHNKSYELKTMIEMRNKDTVSAS